MNTAVFNAITDVNGVLVGHSTVIKKPNIHTGVTAIIPVPGNLYKNPIPAWVYIGDKILFIETNVPVVLKETMREFFTTPNSEKLIH